MSILFWVGNMMQEREGLFQVTNERLPFPDFGGRGDDKGRH